MFALECVGDATGGIWLPSVLLGTGAVLVVLTVLHSRSTEAPLMDLSVLRISTYSVAVTGGTAARVALNAAPFLLPLMFQEGFGLSPFSPGLMLVPLFAGNAVMKVATTPVLRAFAFRRTLLVTGVCAAATFAVTGLVTAQTSVLWIALLLFVGGLARSMQFTALNTLGFADVPAHQMAAANALAALLQQLSATFGVALRALALRLGAAWHGVTQPGVSNFHFAFWVMAEIALIGALDALRLDATAGAEIRSGGLRSRATSFRR